MIATSMSRYARGLTHGYVVHANPAIVGQQTHKHDSVYIQMQAHYGSPQNDHVRAQNDVAKVLEVLATFNARSPTE